MYYGILTTLGVNGSPFQKPETAPKDDLISMLHGWGATIRNQYQLWQDSELVKATGTEHPDDASMVIIEAVWEQLQGE